MGRRVPRGSTDPLVGAPRPSRRRGPGGRRTSGPVVGALVVHGLTPDRISATFAVVGAEEGEVPHQGAVHPTHRGKGGLQSPRWTEDGWEPGV